MEQYCIYLRKSRADIEMEVSNKGETLARHEKVLIELAERLNLNIKCIYKEIMSGETISARPVMQKLLSEVEQKIWSGVLVMEIERLARGNTIDQGVVAQTFQLSNTKIITPLKIYDPNDEFDEEYFEFGLFMSRREYKTINRRLQRGRLASVKEGKYIANQPPYGYIRKKIKNDKGFTLEPVPEEAEIVKFIFDLYSVGELQDDGTYNRFGTGLIANKLNSMKIPAKKGGNWAPSTIRDMLINPIYIGKIRWNWRPASKKIVDGNIKIERPRASMENCILVNGIHPPIIEKETFDLVQTLMSKNPPRPIGEHGIIKNPLAGLIVCGKCGRKMVRRPYNKEKNKPDTLICTAKTCNNVSSTLYCVEDKIISSLEEWLDEYNLSWKLNENVKINVNMNTKILATEKLEREIEKINNQINKLYELLEQGVYSTDVFLKRMTVNSQKLNELKKDKMTIESNLNTEIIKNKKRKNMIPKMKKILEVYKSLKTPKAKNDILKQVLEKVVYEKNMGGRWHTTPDDFEIVLYPKLPNSYIK